MKVSKNLLILTCISCLSLFHAVIGMEKEEAKIFLPPRIETKITKRALTRMPLHPITLWLLERYQNLPVTSRRLTGHTAAVTSVAISPDATKIISGSRDKTIRIWDMACGTCLKVLTGHTDAVNSVAITPDGIKIVSGSGDVQAPGIGHNTIRIWDMARGTCLNTITDHTGPVWSVIVSPDGKNIISGSYAVYIWDMARGNLLSTLNIYGANGARVNSVAINPNGKKIVSGMNDPTIYIWDMATTETNILIASDIGGVNSVAISRDGKKIVSGSDDCTIRIWDMASEICLSTLTSNTVVNSVAISPDSKKIVSGSDDNSICIWDMAITGSLPLNIFTGHTDSVNSVAISPDGKKIVSGSDDKTICICDMPPDLFTELQKLSIAQIRLLEWVYAAAQKNKKLSLIVKELENVRKAYETLQPLIKELVKEYIILPKK